MKSTKGVWLVVSVALAFWACSESAAEPRPSENAAGEPSSNDGGSPTQGPHVGGAAGAEAGLPGHDPEEPTCEAPSVDAVCAERDCPESPDDFDLQDLCEKAEYESAAGVDRYASDCGGVIIEVWGENIYRQSTSYSFDAQGSLLGFTFADDVAVECPNAVGTPCLPVAAAEPLCPVDACGPYPLTQLCDEHPSACPASPEQLDLETFCGVFDVERYASTCDGSVLIVDDPAGGTAWSFDASGALVGVITRGDVSETCEDGNFSFTTIHGEPCEAVGAAEHVCADGTGGAANTGGAGGAAN